MNLNGEWKFAFDVPRHDYGWIGLLGLLGLSGLIRRRDAATRNTAEARGIDNRRIA
jgi:MYXO-CTERM domain-containing protein